MRITDLTFRNFRNYRELSLGRLGQLVVFCGPNAVGKTNILEGINLLTATSSFRHSQISQLIRQGNENAKIGLSATDGNRLLDTELVLAPGKKRYFVNGKPKQGSDVRGVLPSVSFIPDDLELAKKSSGVKRDALDALGIQLSKNYGVVLRDYEKAVRYKNRLLKEEAAPALIDAINETLLAVATQLYCYRRALYGRMVPLVEKNYRDLSQSGEQFSSTYVPSWERMMQTPHEEKPMEADEVEKQQVRSSLYEAFRMMGDEERRSRRTLVGPHHDQITFYLGGGDASSFASQGQQRSIVLAWKIAEVELVRQSLGVNPVLLLDDVMSELDESRRSHLVKTVTSDIQTFITTTDLSPFAPELLERAQIINLKRESDGPVVTYSD